jgi:hypothetical protein
MLWPAMSASSSEVVQLTLRPPLSLVGWVTPAKQRCFGGRVTPYLVFVTR